jgi:hypothetical protein
MLGELVDHVIGIDPAFAAFAGVRLDASLPGLGVVLAALGASPDRRPERIRDVRAAGCEPHVVR